MTPAELSRTVLRAVRRAVEEDVLSAPVPERAAVERTRPGGTGDWASNVALRLAKQAGQSPREVAALLKERIDGTPGIAAVDITGPGFLSFTLADETQDLIVRELLEHGLVREEALAAPEPPAAAVARLGRDAAVWGMLLAAPDAELLAQHERNPLFRVRYAYSRTRALTRNAADLGFDASYDTAIDTAIDTVTDTGVDAPELIGLLGGYAVELEAAVRRAAPERIARHLVAVADAFFRFHDTHRVLPLGDEKPSAAHRSRLAVAEAAGTVLAGGLSQLGVSAPDHL
ncbi:DALR anticodon-binding domain-containing protein [Streptomyces sp. NBC_00237]|uniref:ArgS-related anticodon-binding protein NrtL n=1 Tax=Streptomyces sp. NBC_00237 TaxID=2975687 RepID=UPI00225BFDE0|nr:arginine--tRNA ligase [Streptomyces sp. NBC_00237]MCX5204199.1 DALR anticodon-binding domain-containing protein [Streptomyces sp. NBC_00237]